MQTHTRQLRSFVQDYKQKQFAYIILKTLVAYRKMMLLIQNTHEIMHQKKIVKIMRHA
ncbi:hypothetical protein HMPREF1584_00847 [Gardnerella vaginalis JCP8481A]|nr:hypothetical protein HMPREF1585_00760 [Gardnerella vaginalis JCP8481B]EPI42679.1 hypothetical protein HMPREF1584_00847 [Gardnerella vaginalis JCP8481A]